MGVLYDYRAIEYLEHKFEEQPSIFDVAVREYALRVKQGLPYESIGPGSGRSIGHAIYPQNQAPLVSIAFNPGDDMAPPKSRQVAPSCRGPG